MEPTSSSNVNAPPDKEREHFSLIQVPAPTATTTMTATAVSLPSANNQLVLYTERPQSSFSSISSVISSSSMPSTAASTSSVSAPIEKLSRPMAFDKVCVVSCVSVCLCLSLFYYPHGSPSRSLPPACICKSFLSLTLSLSIYHDRE
jgi:hypothetical protein